MNIGLIHRLIVFIALTVYPNTWFSDGDESGLRPITHCGTSFFIDNGFVSFGREDKTIGHSVPITCKSGYQLVGEPVTTCLPDGSWSENTTCRLRDCGRDISLPNGHVDLTDRKTTYNEIIPVNCVAGYEVHGQQFLTCLSNGRWSEDTSCQKKDCGKEFSLPNGRVSFEGHVTSYGSQISVTCNDGYMLFGSDHIACTSDGVWSKSMQCLIRDCGTDFSIKNGYANFTGKETTYGSSVPVICHEGYQLQGPKNITCLSDGTWGNTTECIIKDCGRSYAIDNGNASFPGHETTYQQTVPINCNEGYGLVGNDYITCEANGLWSKGSSCRIKDCGNDHNVKNSTINFDGLATTYRQKVAVTCVKGFVLDGDPQITCLGTGKWSDDTRCIPQDCGSDYSIPNARIDFGGITTYNRRVPVICNAGYELLGDSFITCLADGTWSKTTSCHATTCRTVFNVDNGKVHFTGTTMKYKETATVSCNTGYELSGSGLIMCLGGDRWNTDSSCHVKDCGKNFEISNGRADFSGVITTYGNKATVSCNLGYNLQGESYTICQADGTWSRFSRCLIKDCGTVYPIEFGYADFADRTTTYRSHIPIICDTGYGLSGDPVITCQDNGQWSDSSVCAVTSCKNNLVISHGLVHFHDEKETPFREQVQLTCNAGYQLVGDTFTTCLQDGTWSMNSVCLIRDCGENITIPNGQVTFKMSQTTFNDTARVTCNDGFEIQDKNYIICLEDGSWSQASCVESSHLLLYIYAAVVCVVIIIAAIITVVVLKKNRKLCFGGRWHRGFLF